MKINKDNINNLKPEQEIWLILEWFQVPRKGIYLGKFGNNYLFVIDNTIIKVYDNYPEHTWEIKAGLLHTTYESMCEKFRERCIQGIEYFNSHQLKKNPIEYK